MDMCTLSHNVANINICRVFRAQNTQRPNIIPFHFSIIAYEIFRININIKNSQKILWPNSYLLFKILRRKPQAQKKLDPENIEILKSLMLLRFLYLSGNF